MPAPVNVKLQTPTISLPNWSREAPEWMRLNATIGGNPDFYPLTVKAAYVIGIIHDLCDSATLLLRHPAAKSITYIPAYGIFASGIDLLGRCLNGNTGTSNTTRDLKTGFKWLVQSNHQQVLDNHTPITTSSYSHTIADLASLRHFAAHGQAQSSISNIDYEILNHMPPLLASGLERYWSDLQQNDDLCNNLAKANIIALRGWPVQKSWHLFEKDKQGRYHGVFEIFSRFKWQL